MPSAITTITMPLYLNVSVNCYLVQTDDAFVLIDTGSRRHRATIEQALADAGCHIGLLRMITLTHGDFDHSGNAAYLSRKYDTAVAMHVDDADMVIHGDMLANRKNPPWYMRGIMRPLMRQFYTLPQADRFIPDLYLEDGDDLTEQGIAAHVVHIPGHSAGSIGILTSDGSLFCGDLLGNIKQPDVWILIVDEDAAQTSIATLQSLDTDTVHPGHGDSFTMTKFAENYQPIDD